MNRQKLFLATYFISAVTFVVPVFAATASSSAKITPLDSKIEDLKERLATKVAELRKTTPKAVSGTVSLVSVSSITIDTGTKAIKIELTDNIDVFQMLKGKRTKLTTDDISKGDTVTIFGDYDQTLDSLSAKLIFIEAPKPQVRIHGIISDIDKKNNQLSVKSTDGTIYSVDVETITKTMIWTPADGIQKSGFSKIEIGMFASILGFPDAKNPNSISATRILHFQTNPGQTPTETLAPTQPATPSAAPTKKPTTTKSKPSPTSAS